MEKEQIFNLIVAREFTKFNSTLFPSGYVIYKAKNVKFDPVNNITEYSIQEIIPKEPSRKIQTGSSSAKKAKIAIKSHHPKTVPTKSSFRNLPTVVADQPTLKSSSPLTKLAPIDASSDIPSTTIDGPKCVILIGLFEIARNASEREQLIKYLKL